MEPLHLHVLIIGNLLAEAASGEKYQLPPWLQVTTAILGCIAIGLGCESD